MWIEPQVELTYGKIGSANYKTDNGVSVRQDGMDSLLDVLVLRLAKILNKEMLMYELLTYMILRAKLISALPKAT